jgi:signal transduction histidine kinase
MLGAVLWTVGLFIGVALLSTALMLRYPRYPLVLHGTALHYAAALTVAVVVCMVVGLLQVRRGLAPLNQLRTRLAAVHAGEARRVDGRYPTEVQPLVNDVNALLDYREEAVRRALAKAGDLAHGLKTPLAVLAHEVEHARALGHVDLAAAMNEQLDRMRRQMDYHLAHARAAASGAAPGAQCRVVESADGLARALRRLHADRGLAIDVQVPSEHAVRAQREDLDEMLGNLVDNACKWARTSVAVASSAANGAVVMTVDDDGPGLADSLREAVLQRGVRADEAAAGTGFGLTIVRDLAELYGGSIVLERAAAGGVRARLTLPAA